MTDTHNNLTLTPMQAAGAIRYASTYNGSGQYTSEQLAIAKDMAYEALEKQIPKKTTKRQYVPNGTLIYGHCPNCDGFTKNFFKYCKDCGQALDWSDTE